MISLVQPIHSGNALRLFIEPPPGSVRWRVLRKGADTFTGEGDPEAFVAYEGDERVFVDASFLQNQQMVFYRAYFTADGVTWVAGPTAHGTPDATYEEVTTDVLSFLRERMEAGLLVEVQRGSLVSDVGYIPVYTASPSLDRDLPFPLVTLHLESEDPNTHAVGQDIIGDTLDGFDGEWEESDGWLAHVNIAMIGWSLNADERNELRKCMRRVVLANMPVFYGSGWDQIELNLSNVDAVSGEYPAHIFQVMGTFTCLAPTRVASNVAPIREVISRSVNP